jgi:hypothetical protein
MYSCTIIILQYIMIVVVIIITTVISNASICMFYDVDHAPR